MKGQQQSKRTFSESIGSQMEPSESLLTSVDARPSATTRASIAEAIEQQKKIPGRLNELENQDRRHTLKQIVQVHSAADKAKNAYAYGRLSKSLRPK